MLSEPQQENTEEGSAPAETPVRSLSLPMGDYTITASGDFPEGTELQAVVIPQETAAKLSGKTPLFAYDIRLVVDGQVWQPEDYGKSVQLSVLRTDDPGHQTSVELFHVKTDLMDENGNLSEEKLEKALQDVETGSVETENLATGSEGNSFNFTTSSFSGFVGNILYGFDAKLYKPDTGNYPGVYSTKLTTNNYSAEEVKTNSNAHIGMSSIADQNLTDIPTTESPAIIQGAAVGYEERLGPVDFKTIKERPVPYSEFKFKILEEEGQDGTVHKKPSGFDGTFVIVRLDVSEFFKTGNVSDNLYLHMEQKDNKALMVAATVAKGTVGYVQPTNEFTDNMGNRSASYNLSELVDPSDNNTPYLDVILYATAANVAGADAQKTDVPKGDVQLALYVDQTRQYNSELVDYDPPTTQTQTSPTYEEQWHAKFFDASKATSDVSHYLIKGSDLALETMVENSGGEGKDTGTTYWSMKKSMEHPYYDLEEDKDPSDPGCGRTVTLMSEVAITGGLTLQGTDENNLKKRTLNVNSYDVQVANNVGKEGEASEAFNLTNSWLTITDNSNTTGAEMAIGNNAKFVIDQGGKLIIDDTCQLEIEWDGATTAPGTQPTTPDVLNNGMLDLRAGGEIVNNGIITIEGFEGKPFQPGQGSADAPKGCGEMTIEKGAKLTNNGSLMVYGKFFNLGEVVNNGRYNDLILSNDPDKGVFPYHKGIIISWKDDVTQKNVEPGAFYNGKDGQGTIVSDAVLRNYGDIVLIPGNLWNYGILHNGDNANIFLGAATDAIIPIEPDPKAPTIVTKRIKLNPVAASSVTNLCLLVNDGKIVPASVVLNDNLSFGALTTPGKHPELFGFYNYGVVENNGYIYGWPNKNPRLLAVLMGVADQEGEIWLYLYEDMTFLLVMQDGEKLPGTYRVENDQLIFTAEKDILPEKDQNGNAFYRFQMPSGREVEILFDKQDVDEVCRKVEELNTNKN